MLAQQETGEISEDMTKDLCMDLLIAGTDTSAQTVNWFLLILANRPEIQAQVHEELDRVIGRPSASSGQANSPTVDDRTRLPYLFACLAESMRYRTIGPFGLPHKASEDAEVGGYLIPAGTQVLGNIYSIHHDPRYWDSPDEFIPERFLPQEDGSMSAALTGPPICPSAPGTAAVQGAVSPRQRCGCTSPGCSTSCASRRPSAARCQRTRCSASQSPPSPTR